MTLINRGKKASIQKIILKFDITKPHLTKKPRIFSLKDANPTILMLLEDLISNTMDADFNSYQNYIRVNLSGLWVADDAKNALKASREAAQAASVDKILLDMTQIELPDSDLVRIDSAESLVEILGTSIKVAVVKRKDDPSNLGYQFAQSRGANIHVTTDSKNALDWLLSD